MPDLTIMMCRSSVPVMGMDKEGAGSGQLQTSHKGCKVCYHLAFLDSEQKMFYILLFAGKVNFTKP